MRCHARDSSILDIQSVSDEFKMSWLQAPKANQAPGKRPRRDPEKSAASKLDYETKRKRNFLPSWTEKFPWLRYTEEAGEEYMMYCSTCRSLPDIADTAPEDGGDNVG
ncbi:hypothetical protein NQZ68_026657 [Dissostichus eleginoides]|nr:hypothetical protein NQZ68_026657 [Dissostichus eleginoides]